MKRSIRLSIAASALAGAGLIAVAPAALAVDYPGSPAPTATSSPSAAASPAPSGGGYEVGDGLPVSGSGLAPDSTGTVYGAPTGDQSVVRQALLAHAAHVVAAPAVALSLVAAVPSNAVFLGQFTTDATGAFSTTVKLPASLVGHTTIYVSGVNTAGQAVTTSFSVTVSPAGTRAALAAKGSSSGLPFTGSDSIIPLTIAGVAALGIGSGLVVFSRRRRAVSTPAA